MPALDTTEWTVEMLDELLDASAESDGSRYELIDGQLVVTPAPGEIHQLVLLELAFVLKRYLRGSTVGRVFAAPSDVWKEERRRNRVQPDVFVLRLLDGKRPPYPYEMADLLLAVEVASPGSLASDYQTKRELYLRNGVGEYWVVNAEARNVSRWRGATDPGEVLSERLVWQPTGVAEPLVIELPSFFDEAVA